MLFVICYIPGTFGTALCHFINSHDNFYTTHRMYTKWERSGGAFLVDGNLNIYPEGESKIQCNELRESNIAVKPHTEDNNQYAHSLLKNYESHLEENKIKLIFILPTDEIIANIKERNVWEDGFKGDSWWEKEFVPNILNFKKIIKMISKKYSYNKDFFCVRMEDIFSWVNHKDTYPRSYLNLCQFLNTKPRPTVKLDLKRVFYNTKYQGKEI